MAVAVLAPLWAVGLAVRPGGTVLWPAVAVALAMGAVALALQGRHRAPVRVGHDVWLAVPAALVHLVLSYLLVPVAVAVVPVLGRQADELVFDARTGLPLPVVALIAAVVVAPLEELFWRGTVQPGLGLGHSRSAAVALGTATFVGFHLLTLQLPLMAAALLGGLVWGWLYERTGGIAAPAFAHAVWTTAMVLRAPT